MFFLILLVARAACAQTSGGMVAGNVVDEQGKPMEYATVAAASLAAYPDPNSVEALKKALHSANWYVRSAAAQSLEELQVDYTDVLDITTGSDRYAKEIMLYRLELRKLQEQGV